MRIRRDPEKFVRALSVKQPYANQIRKGLKPAEYRKQPTNYRGELLIVSSKRPDLGAKNLPAGVAVCLVDVVDCRKQMGHDRRYAWILENPREVEPVKIKGNSATYYVPRSKVKIKGA